MLEHRSRLSSDLFGNSGCCLGVQESPEEILGLMDGPEALGGQGYFNLQNKILPKKNPAK